MKNIKPLAEGDTHEDSDLQSLCINCHEMIHQRNKKDGWCRLMVTC